MEKRPNLENNNPDGKEQEEMKNLHRRANNRAYAKWLEMFPDDKLSDVQTDSPTFLNLRDDSLQELKLEDQKHDPETIL